jgi:hypothetical protein
MRFVTVTTITTGLNICFIEANPVGAAIITVPFNWELQNNGLSYARSVVYNNGSGTPKKADPKTLTSLITVIANHQAPPNARRLDPLPQTTSLNVTGGLLGQLGGTCVAYISKLTGFNCYSKANAELTSPLMVKLPEQLWEEVGVFPVNVPLNETLNVAVGNYPITASVEVSTLFGLGSGFLGDEVSGDVTLFISSRFSPGLQTTFDIRYETGYESVPEPLTMFGAAAALGYGTLLKRQSSKNKKS